MKEEGNNAGLGEKEKFAAFCLGYVWLFKILKL